MNRPLSKGRKAYFTILSIIILSAITFSLLEATFRIAVYWKSQYFPTQTTESDTFLGWQAVPDFQFNGTVKDAANNAYQLDFQTDENGFRYFAPTKDRIEKKILFIGDSYTHAIEVSNDKTYYGLLKETLEEEGVAIYAYGVRGFGLLQEKLWLEKWYDKIQPDIVVWQFCFNDVYNAHYLLENQSYYNNNRHTRPYLIGSEIQYFNPARLGMEGIRNWSLFLDFVVTKLELFLENNDHEQALSSEDLIAKEGKAYAVYANSLLEMEHVIQQTKEMIGPTTQLIAFPVDNNQPYIKDLTQLFENNNIPVIHQIPSLIDQEKEKGETVFARDGAHWNEKGHAIASEEIRLALGAYLDNKGQ